MTKSVNDLYRLRNELIDNGFELDSIEVLNVEKEIDEIEVLPTFDEVIEMISSGRMVSVFK